MSSGTMYLALIVVLPIIALFLLRVNAAAVFLSLCLGYVLLSFDSSQVRTLANTTNVPVHVQLSTTIVNLVLLLGPAVITIATQFHSVHGQKKMINLLPAVACGLFAALLVVPLLPYSLMHAVISSSYWQPILKFKADIVGLGAAVSILFFWSTLHHGGGNKHSKTKA